MHSKYHIRILFITIITLSISTVTKAQTGNDRPAEAIKSNKKYVGAYCGVSCLYTIMKLSDKDVKYKDLLKVKYIGSNQGSSLAELKKAAEDYGMYAVPVGNLTSRILMESAYPIILHVKADVSAKKYEHYELFLGTKNGQAILYNPPEPVKPVTFHELAPRWDGKGLIVSERPIDLGGVFAPVRKRFVIYVMTVIALILIVRFCKRRWLSSLIIASRHRLLGLSAAQSIVLTLAALLCGFFYHFINDEGFLAHDNATDTVVQAHLSNFMPKITQKQIQPLLNTDTVFIDARLNRDFEAGHLDGAINIPVIASDEERRKITANIATNAHVVVYCQSAGCEFAEEVALKLTADGFSNISIFKEGWQKWVEKNN